MKYELAGLRLFDVLLKALPRKIKTNVILSKQTNKNLKEAASESNTHAFAWGNVMFCWN